MQKKQQIFYVTVLLGLASDAHPNVRGAAIRCLGVYCLFPTLSTVKIIILMINLLKRIIINCDSHWDTQENISVFTLDKY